jgi:N-acetylglucosaminyldiphosphoundecaprenol N-acetyl-beta-D-mannosaminyltransferase
MSVNQHGKGNILGVDVDAIDYGGIVDRVLAGARERRPLSVTATAVHGIMCAVLDRQHRFRLNMHDIVAPDGQPVRWALNLLHGARLADRTYGPELTLRILAAAAEHGIPVCFYGSRPEVLHALCARMTERFPALQIADSRPSLFRRSTADEQADIVAAIRRSGARIVFVGLGCPRQEVWAYENARDLSLPVIAVGAAFDFLAGLLPQAPPALQKRGLEWAFRLWQEPRRLWRRYLYLNPAFLVLLTSQLLRVGRFADRGTRPQRTENYA